MKQNLQFGRLIEGQLVHPTIPLTHNGRTYLTQNPKVMLSLGWKEIIYAVQPQKTLQGKYESSYSENDSQIFEHWNFIPYSDEELQQSYKQKVIELITTKYSNNDENKILREYLAYPNQINIQEQFLQYNLFVEKCKREAHMAVYGE